MLYINYSFTPIFIFWAGIILFLNIQGFLTKKSIFNGINLAFCLVLLYAHLKFKESLPDWSFCIISDMIFLSISVALFLYVNDIETRRKVISEVFENRYKKRGKKWEH